MTAYSTGTVSLGSGSTTLTGSGTAWTTSGIRAGDYLHLAGLTVRIASVDSATQITLARPWPGSTQSGSNYDVELVDDGLRALTAMNELLQVLNGGTLTSLAELEGVANKMPYFSGANTMGLADLSTLARNLLDDTSQAAMQATLGLVPTESALDGASGRLLQTGDFGLGGVAISVPTSDLNECRQSGFYYFESSTENRPSSVTNGLVLQMQRTGSIFTQLAISRASSNPGAIHARANTGSAWSAWRRIYDQSNILGTVSQSGGVPTGALIERGSNANGEYARFADGTQICASAAIASGAISTAAGNIFTETAGQTHTFPAAFATTPNVCGAMTSYAQGWLGIASLSTTTCLVRAMSAFSTVTQNMRIIAFGRWF